MNRNGWILAGSTAALAGAFALSLAQTPATAPPVASAATPDPVSVPAPAAIAAPVVAAPVAVAPKAIAPTPAPGVVAGSAGMVIAIDPETGVVGLPTPEQMDEMKITEDDAVSRSAAGLVEVRHASGAVSIDLQGRFQDYAIVRRAADGTLTFGCIDHPADIDHAHTAPAALEEK